MHSKARWASHFPGQSTGVVTPLVDSTNTGSVLNATQFEVAPKQPAIRLTPGRSKQSAFEFRILPGLPADARICLPLSGGRCRYYVTLTNTTDHRLDIRAWSLVDAYYVGPFAQDATIQSPRAYTIRLTAGQSQRIAFKFDVPPDLPLYACHTPLSVLVT